MNPSKIHCYLIYSEKHKPIGQTDIAKIGKAWDFLSAIFDKSEEECSIGIDFVSVDQKNVTQQAVTKYIQSSTLARGLPIATLLRDSTPTIGGIGLLFLMTGSAGGRKRLVMSRFPAESGLVADDTHKQLLVDFVERLFLKDRRQYKSVLYEDTTANIKRISSGRAVDRQDHTDRMMSDYWVYHFLNSDYSNKSLRGSRMFGEGIKTSFNSNHSSVVRSEIQAIVTFIQGRNGQRISASEIVSQFAPSEETVDAIRSSMSNEAFDQHFVLDITEFQKMTPYKTVELDSGAVLTAPIERFEDAFKQVRSENGTLVFQAAGSIVETKLRKSR